MNSRLKFRLPRLPEKKHSWADPERSVGQFCGTVKGKLSYWEAKGPAQEAYEKIQEEIQEILNKNLDPVRGSSAVVYDIYMFGPSPQSAKPHVMFSCKQGKSRKEAVSAVRKSGLLSQSPGIEIGHWECPPHIVNSQLLASSASQAELDSSLATYNLRPILDANNPSSTLALQFPRYGPTETTVMPSISTIGSVVKHNGIMFYLVAEHALSMQEHVESNNLDSASADEDSECELGGFLDDEGVTDEEAEFMSQYSASPPSSDVDTDFDTESDDDQCDDEDADISLLYKKDSSSCHEPDDARSSAPVPIVGPSPIAQTDLQPTISSVELDYALLQASGQSPPPDLPILSWDTVAEVKPGTTEVATVTGSGYFLRGKLSGRPSHVRVPFADNFQKVFTVTFDGPILPGDSGSIVRNRTTGQIYGHIFLGSVESRVAYIMPAVNVLRHMENLLNDRNQRNMQQAVWEPAIPALTPGTQAHILRPSPSRYEYTIGWICSHPEEMAAAQLKLDEIYDSSGVTSHDKKLERFGTFCRYVLGRIGSHKVVLAMRLHRRFPGWSQMPTSILRTAFPRLGFILKLGAAEPNAHIYGDTLVGSYADTPTNSAESSVEGACKCFHGTSPFSPEEESVTQNSESGAGASYGFVVVDGKDSQHRVKISRDTTISRGPLYCELNCTCHFSLDVASLIVRAVCLGGASDDPDAGRGRYNHDSNGRSIIIVWSNLDELDADIQWEHCRRCIKVLICPDYIPLKPPQLQHLAGSHLAGNIYYTPLEPEPSSDAETPC
ncbi:hypothetical protein BDV18DRAFT_161707 [Aspergillus unguis]